MNESKSKQRHTSGGIPVSETAFLDGGEYSLIDAIRLVKDNWVLVFGIVAFATSISIVVALLLTPVYRSSVLLAPATSEGSIGGIAGLAGQLGISSLGGLGLGGSDSAEEAIAILKSREFTTLFINKYGLLPELFREKWDPATESWDVKDPEKIPSEEDAFIRFNEKVRTVSPQRKTEMIVVGIEWYDRELAAVWANRIVDDLNEFIRTRDISEAQKSIEFLEAALAEAGTVELKQAISNLIERQIENEMLASVREEYVFRVLDHARVADLDKRIRPNRKIIVITVFVVSFFLAIAIVILRSMLLANRQ